MAVDLNRDALREAGIGNFFRPSQLEQLGIPYHKLRQLEAQKRLSSAWAGDSTGLPTPNRRNVTR